MMRTEEITDERGMTRLREISIVSCRDSHGGEEQAVEAEVRMGLRGDATLREIIEALDIKYNTSIVIAKACKLSLILT